MEEQNKLKWALITGSTNGLGYEFVKLFAQNGINLILIGRDQSKLDQLTEEILSKYKVATKTICCNLVKPDAAPLIYAEAMQWKIDVHFLVNCAGVGTFGEFQELNLSKELDMININVLSVVSLTNLFGKDMVTRDQGMILNIGSIAGFQPVPLMNNYAASKAYVNSFTQTLACELRNSNVSVSLLCPGPFLSGFKDTAVMNDSKNFKGRMLSVRQIAEIGYKGMYNKKNLIIPGFINKLLIFSQRFVPRFIVTKIALSKVSKI